ncbi:MAG TPA: LCP family protein [Candidatus Avacidaminococcus intestinavium]|uniref:LCP family protein n=1 Tax=Candidatus Avacidaminococcus intestinavium TaxID=2840684 RepID=A0A9D1MR71_9FIRM|nr:LCP family protein [Candidatus Avacidaminococcus intestinavium]
MSEYETGQPRRRRKIRVGRLILLIILFVAILTGCFFLGQALYNFFSPKPVPIVAADENIATDETLNKRINILIMGIDDGDNEYKDAPKRTDAMLVASFDPTNKDVALLSLPRDTGVAISGHKTLDKLNHAYAYGGVSLAKKTVAGLLKIPIHHYVLLNWQGFIEVINILGGIDYYVEHDMNYEDPYADLSIHIAKGFQHMDGKTAGEYIRFRNDELGDIGRVQRQQRFLKALTTELFSLENVVKVPTLMNSINEHIETDMDLLTMIKAANSFKVFGGDKLRTQMLYGDFQTINDVSYWITTQEKVEQSLAELNIPHKKVESK